MAHRSVSSRWRALSLILIGLVAGTLLLGTASAHIGTPSHLWKQHIKAKVKAFGDKRWLNTKEIKVSGDPDSESFFTVTDASPTEIGSLSITAPSNGFLVISGFASLNENSTGSSFTLELWIDAAQTTDRCGFFDTAPDPGPTDEFTFGCTATRAVTAGAHTVSMTTAGSTDYNVLGHELTALFVPAGSLTTTAPSASSGGGGGTD